MLNVYELVPIAWSSLGLMMKLEPKFSCVSCSAATASSLVTFSCTPVVIIVDDVVTSMHVWSVVCYFERFWG